jgi:hypothetical protein
MPDRFRTALRLIRVIRVICEICGLNYLYIPCESVTLLKKERIMKEINTVTYDPAAVTIGDMEAALKKAKTYQSRAAVAK